MSEFTARMRRPEGLPCLPATHPAVDVRQLTVVRGDRPVLTTVSLQVAHGQVVGLLGPSGSGKSTLMRAVVGVQRVATGSIAVLGLPSGDARLRRRVAYVTQSPSVYGDLTVTDNLHYFGRLQGLRSVDLVAEVHRVVDAVRLEDHQRTIVGRLSGGERNRVSLAAALLGRPELLVLDEPTVGLDPVLRRDLWSLFHQLADSGVTLFVSSHVMDEATRCDRLLLLRAGRLVADESPSSLLQRTGAVDADTAFLRLIEADEGASS